MARIGNPGLCRLLGEGDLIPSIDRAFELLVVSLAKGSVSAPEPLPRTSIANRWLIPLPSAIPHSLGNYENHDGAVYSASTTTFPPSLACLGFTARCAAALPSLNPSVPPSFMTPDTSS